MPENWVSGKAINSSSRLEKSQPFDRLLVKALFTSTRNSDEAHLHLLQATSCNKFFFSEERETRTLEIKGLFPSLEVFRVPTLKEILSNEGGQRSYAYTKSYADAENETLCIIHSSGTTGRCMTDIMQ